MQVFGKFLYLMGCSGSGKTMLAKNLESFDGEYFSNILETTTRKPRTDEENGKDYIFLTDEEFDRISPFMFETVEYQYLPSRYGAEGSRVSRTKWNIVVASIEGLLSGLRNTILNQSEIVVFNIINDDSLDIERAGRDFLAEERINKAVLNNIGFRHEFKYYEMKLSKLKEIRNDKEKLIEYFKSICK